MIKPHNPNATATAFIKGLAIARYDEAQSKWEVQFLRNCGHYPQLRIKELDRQNGTILSTVRIYEIASGDSLSITVEDASGETQPRYTTGGKFNRNNPGHDAQDLRWMLDIDQLHGTATRERDDPVEINLLSVSGGCFYTGVRTGRIYRKRWVDRGGKPSATEPIGLSGRTFGVDFQGKSVTVEVRGTDGFSQELPHKTNSRYELVFDNTCFGENQPPPGETDFQDYYKLIDDSEGKVEIFPPEEEVETAGGAASGGGNVIPPADDGGGGGDDGGTTEEGDGDDDPRKTPACHAITGNENA